jgi:hypothetical protein
VIITLGSLIYESIHLGALQFALVAYHCRANSIEMLDTCAVKQVLHTAELLGYILRSLNDSGEQKTIANCALVCKFWLHESVRLMWRSIYSLVPIVGLLGDSESYVTRVPAANETVIRLVNMSAKK